MVSLGMCYSKTFFRPGASLKDSKGRLRVEKVRIQKRHLKAGRKGARTGGIIEQEGFIDASNVMLVDPKDDRPSRVRVEEREGQRVRVFVKSGDPVPETVRS